MNLYELTSYSRFINVQFFITINCGFSTTAAILEKSKCQWLRVGDNFWMWVTDFRSWWHIWNENARRLCQRLLKSLELRGRGYCRPRLPKSSPISGTCHQHISSPIFVIIIDLPFQTGLRARYENCEIQLCPFLFKILKLPIAWCIWF